MQPDGAHRDAEAPKRLYIILRDIRHDLGHGIFRRLCRIIRCRLHKLVLEPEFVRDAGTRKLNLDLIGRSRSRYHSDNRAELVRRDVVTQTHPRFCPEPNEITDLEPPQSHTRRLPILLDEDNASCFKGAFHRGQLFGLTIVFACLEVRESISMNPEASASRSRLQFSSARAARICSGCMCGPYCENITCEICTTPCRCQSLSTESVALAAAFRFAWKNLPPVHVAGDLPAPVSRPSASFQFVRYKIYKQASRIE